MYFPLFNDGDLGQSVIVFVKLYIDDQLGLLHDKSDHLVIVPKQVAQLCQLLLVISRNAQSWMII